MATCVCGSGLATASGTGIGNVTCPGCAGTTASPVTAIAPAPTSSTARGSVAGGVVAGFLAAALAAGIWFALVATTGYQIGVVAVVVGWLVGRAVVLGARGRRGPVLQLASVSATLLAMAVAEYLVARHFAVQALALEGVSDIPLLLPLGTAAGIIVESVSADPLTLLFWAVAVYQAWRVPAGSAAA